MKRAKFGFELGVAIQWQLEDYQRLIPRFDFSLPAINRMDLRQNISAGGEPKLDDFSRDPPGGFGIRKGAERENDFVRHCSRRLQRGRAANPSPADYNVAIVDNGGLPRRDRFLRLVKLNASAAVFEDRD